MTMDCRRTYIRAASAAMAALAVLVAMLLLTSAPGEAASTYTVTFDALGGDKGNLSVRKGDVVVFKNALPLLPLTGAVAPVQMSFGGESFAVAGTPIARTITRSVSYSGTYSVLGLVPLTRSGGTITVVGDPPSSPSPSPSLPSSPSPSAADVEPSSPAESEPPPAHGTTPTTPGGSESGDDTTAGGTATSVPQGDSEGVSEGDSGSAQGGTDTATGSQPGGGQLNGPPPGSTAEQVSPPVGPESDTNTALPPAPEGPAPQPTMTNTAGSPVGGLGLTAIIGAVLLLGVGIALTRTMINGHLKSPVTA